MVKRFALVLLASSTSALAFPQPPDVPAYVSWTPTYKTDGTLNTTIDPTVTPPPAYAYQLTNIAVPSLTGRITTGTFNNASGYCSIVADGGPCAEYKFRTSVDCGKFLPDDPQRNYGQPGSSHLHEFCGAGSPNAYSTYKTLRNHALDSMATGVDPNGTAYWRPGTEMLNPFGDGKNYAIYDDFWTVYYVGEPGKKLALYPRGMRFVWGFDMDSASVATQYAWLQTTLTAANATQGYTRYSLTNPTTGKMSTASSYACTGATPSEASSYVNSDGSDPFAGTCAAGAQFYAKTDGPKCWDGINLWSPGGYKHLIPAVWDTVASAFVCSYNSYQTVSVRIEATINQQGWTDRQRFILSSDIAYRAAKGLNATQLPAGTTLHWDWQDGWDHNIFDAALQNCAGAMGVQGHECNSSVYSPTAQLGLSSGNGLSRSPQVDFTGINHSVQTNMMLIPPAWSGPMTNMKMCNNQKPCP